jgi:type IV pilus assembly protein PilA
MHSRQAGIGVIQAVLAIAVTTLLATIAIPQYQEFVIRSKMSEAFTLASDTKNKLTEFYTMNNRFPKKVRERASIQTVAYTPPEFVEEVAVNYKDETNDVVIEVYFKEGSIPGTAHDGDFLYLAGNAEPGGTVQWTCAANGIDNRFLPDYCES